MNHFFLQKISTQLVRSSGYLLAKQIAKFKNRKEVLNTIFFKPAIMVIASYESTKKVLLAQDFIDIKQLPIL